MIFGIAKEIKPQEGRVALVPQDIALLIADGHEVYCTSLAGVRAGITDADYQFVGAQIVNTNEALFAQADAVVKVKEILPPEYGYLRAGQCILTNLHTAGNPELTQKLLQSGVIGVALEDCQVYGSPNSAFAGEIGAYEGVRLQFTCHGGSGRHFIGRHGAEPIKAVVIGLGGVGSGAVRVLTALGCQTLGLDSSASKRESAARHYAGTNFRVSDIDTLAGEIADADLIINAVIWNKARTDHLITRADLKKLKSTCVIVDISCDEQGAIETSRASTWSDPVYVEEGIRHFCVDNIPGAVAVQASYGYSASIVGFLREIGAAGFVAACRQNAALRRGVVCANGQLCHAETAQKQNLDCRNVEETLATIV